MHLRVHVMIINIANYFFAGPHYLIINPPSEAGLVTVKTHIPRIPLKLPEQESEEFQEEKPETLPDGGKSYRITAYDEIEFSNSQKMAMCHQYYYVNHGAYKRTLKIKCAEFDVSINLLSILVLAVDAEMLLMIPELSFKIAFQMLRTA